MLDADAWNELAGLVYLAAGKQPKQTNLERIDYGHEIYYKPPAMGADRDLPFRIQKVAFQTILAGGAILYDPATNRTTAAEETFRVRATFKSRSKARMRPSRWKKRKASG